MLSHCVDGKEFFSIPTKVLLTPTAKPQPMKRWELHKRVRESQRKMFIFIFPSSSYASRIFPTQSKVLEDYQFCFSTVRSSVYVVFFPALRSEKNSNESREIFTQIQKLSGGNSQQTFFSSLSLKIVLESPKRAHCRVFTFLNFFFLVL